MAYRKFNGNGDGQSAEDRSRDRFADLMMKKSRVCSPTGRSHGSPRAA